MSDQRIKKMKSPKIFCRSIIVRSKSQLSSLTNWMNSWEHLRGNGVLLTRKRELRREICKNSSHRYFRVFMGLLLCLEEGLLSVGYHNKCHNTIRLWSTTTDLQNHQNANTNKVSLKTSTYKMNLMNCSKQKLTCNSLICCCKRARKKLRKDIKCMCRRGSENNLWCSRKPTRT